MRDQKNVVTASVAVLHLHPWAYDSGVFNL